MAKMFYTAEEAAKRLGKTEDDLRAMVREGTLREFRDAGKVNYKVEDVEELARAGGASSGSTGGEIILEPADDSGIQLSQGGGSDVLSLEEVDPSEDTASGTAGSGTKAKEGSVVPSVGVNVFDDDELDEVVDPLAQTAVTDVAGLGIDGAGSGSGIMNLSRESDDTSLGAELLDEIYSPDEAAGGDVEMGDATRAGLEEAIPEGEEAEAGDEDVFQPQAPASADVAAPARTEVVRVVQYGPDAVSTGLTAAMFVAVIVMWIAGLAAAAMVRGIAPGIVQTLYDNLLVFTGGAIGLSAVVGGVAFFLAKRSE